MIATETTGAAVIVSPMGNAVVEVNVAHGALLGTQPTMAAYIGIDGELAVSNHTAVEVTADDVGHEPGGGS